MTDRRWHRPVKVIIVSKDPSDAHVLENALEDIEAPLSSVALSSTEEASKAVPSVEDELFETIPFVLVSLSVGMEETVRLVDAIKSDPARCRAPIIVLAPDSAPSNKLYDAFVNAIVPWPEDADERIDQLDTLFRFWLNVPALP